MTEKIYFMFITANATKPSKATPDSAGYDLSSAYDYIIPPKDKLLIMTDLQLEFPINSYGRIAPRSGLALNHFIDVGAGVIDRDYRGNVGALLFNFGNMEFIIKKGDRIAQIICEHIYMAEMECQTGIQGLTCTVRNMNGFGSSGIN